MNLAIRGLTYPRTRVQAYPVTPRGAYFTRHRLLLLEGAGEEEWTRSVKGCCRYYPDWQGFHTRDSDGVMESIHVERLDGYTEAKGAGLVLLERAPEPALLGGAQECQREAEPLPET